MMKKNLSDLCNILIGRTPPRGVSEYWGKGYKWVSISDMKEEVISSTKEEITEEAIKSIHCRKIPKGTLLLSFKLSVGKLAFAGTDLYTNEAIAALIIKDNSIFHSRYLYFALKVIKFVGGNQAVMGVTLNSKSLAKLKIPLPPLDDQIRIATILTRTEALIAKRKESIQALDELLNSTFMEMFGDLENNTQNFEVTYLEELCSDIVDCPHSTPIKADFVTNYPCIRTSELKEGYIFWDSMQYISEEEYSKRTRRLKPNEGDIIYGREGSFGEAIRIPASCKFSLGQRTMLFRPDYSKCNSIFLWAMVRSEYVYKQAKKKNSGSTVGHVNVKDIKKFKTILPPFRLQNQLAAIVEKVESLKLKYTQSLNELENLYASLTQRAFKGELDLSKIPVEKEKQTVELHGKVKEISSIAGELSVSTIYSETELLKIIQSMAGNAFTFDTLMIKLKKASFEKMPEYEELKNQIYKMLKGKNSLLSQTFDKAKKEMVLSVNK